MRAFVVFPLLAIAACAPKTPLELIPREELLMIEAAEKLDVQAPVTVPSRPRSDVEAEYAAALRLAGGTPQTAPNARPAGGQGPVASAPIETADAGALVEPEPAPMPAGPISIEMMLARVRQQAESQADAEPSVQSAPPAPVEP